MADNTTLSVMSGGDVCATDDIASGVAAGAKVQRIKQGFGADGTYTDVDSMHGLPVALVSSATATLTNVTGSASSVQLLASNTSRTQALFFNDSTANLFLKFGTTASTTSFTVKIAAGGYYEMPRSVYNGRIDGIWDAANGAVRITELT